MKKYTLLYLIAILLLVNKKGTQLYAQQLPYYTQFKTNMYMINPAITGTKRTIDVRINDRIQWVGYDGAPSTMAFSVHGRFFKGKMGAGLSVLKDQIGPSKQTDISASYAYHIRFPDVELSIGAAGNFTKYTLDGSQITLHNTQDPAIDQTKTSYDWIPDASFGMYLYNDRFHFGFSALHLVQSKGEFFKNDTAKKGIIQNVPHGNFTLGYNYSNNPNFIIENTLYVNYVPSVPVSLDYTLRLHYLNKVFAGFSLRMKDAIALQVGGTFWDCLQVSYSYDILTSKVRPYSRGTHEIMLAFSHNIHFIKSKFAHQRYAYMF